MTKGWGICWSANDVVMVRRLGTKVFNLCCTMIKQSLVLRA